MQKLSNQDAIEIRRLYLEGFTKEQLRKMFKVTWATIYDIVKRRTRKHI